jgi:hypothetical protein
MPPLNGAAINKVLKIYTATMKTSLNEHQDAFDAAVGAYRDRNPDVSEKVGPPRGGEDHLQQTCREFPRCSDIGDHGPADARRDAPSGSLKIESQMPCKIQVVLDSGGLQRTSRD